MKVTILGYWGGFPSAGGATMGTLVSTQEGEILLDCGSGVASRLFFYTNIESISGVIISHLHYDHMADLGVLQYATANALRNKRTKDKLKVYAPAKPEGMWETIHSENSETYELNEEKQISIVGSDISFISVQHTIPCFAAKMKYKDKVLTYITDTIYFDGLADFARNSDLLICGAAICPGSTHTTGKGHMDAHQAGIIARKANARNMVITHLPHDGDFNLMKKQAEDAYGRDVCLPNIKSTYLL